MNGICYQLNNKQYCILFCGGSFPNDILWIYNINENTFDNLTKLKG